MYQTSDLDTSDKKFGPSKYVTFGVQELKINSLDIKVASTGSKQVIFNVESKPVTEDGFEGDNGALGRVGRISTMYMKPEQEKEILFVFAKIADALGVRAELDKVVSSATSFENLIEVVTKVISGKFANFTVATEQYLNNEGKVRNSLRFPKYDFVEKIGTTPSRMKFDEANSHHFKKAVIPDNIGTSSSKTAVKAPLDDLPF